MDNWLVAYLYQLLKRRAPKTPFLDQVKGQSLKFPSRDTTATGPVYAGHDLNFPQQTAVQ